MAFVIVGATGTLGRELAARLARDGHALVLVARRAEALAALARDIAGAGGPPAVIAADVTEGPRYLERVIAAAAGRGGVEGLLLPIGAASRDDLSTPGEERARLVDVNFTAVAEAVEGLWAALGAAPRPVIVGFGSVTAIRGRGRNLVYGAAKRALASYFESLRLLGAGAGITVQFYVLGFLAGGPGAVEPTPLPKGDPGRLAERVVANLARGSAVRWYPRWWAPLALALRLMPAPLYRRLAAGRGRA